MQKQIDQLSSNLSRYMKQQERERKEARDERSKVFDKLDEAARERSSILVQTTKTNGRVNMLEKQNRIYDQRVEQLELDQRDTLKFKGGTMVITGIITAVIISLLSAFIKGYQG